MYMYIHTHTHVYIYIYIYIKLDFKEVKWGVMGWIELAQDRDRWQALVNAVMNIRIP
jgi:hypothetical protein